MFAQSRFCGELLEPRLVLDSTVVFNELMYHPPGDEATREWIELHNQMSVDIELSGWKLRGGVDYDFPTGTIVRGGGYLVVAADPAALSASSGYASALGPFSGRLDNSGERLELRDNNDRVMDAIDYADEGAWPVGPDGGGVSLAKIDRNTASDVGANWRSSKVLGGTPGLDNDALRQSVVLAADASWRFNDTGVDLQTSWRDAEYDDSTWSAGNGLFYHTDAALGGPKNTPLTPGRSTYYFRTTFNFASDPAGATLLINPLIDDGAVVYLNGVEVYRRNMPAGTVNYNTTATGVIGDAAFAGPISLPTANLVAGQNVLAVEVHQANEFGPGETLAYYRFEEPAGTDIFDAISGADHGDVVGTATRITDVATATVPQTGQANTRALDFATGGFARFAGTAQKFIFNAGSGATGDATLEWYMRTAGSPHSAMFWTNDDTTSDSNRFNLYWNSSWLPGPPANSERFIAGDGNPTGVVGQYNNAVPLSLSAWHHVAIVRRDATPANTADASFTWEWYIDGQLSAAHSSTTSGALPTATKWLLAGRQGSHSFNGQIDEVRFTRGALSPGRFLNATPTPTPAGDVAFGAILTSVASAAALPTLALNEVASAMDATFRAELVNYGTQPISLGGVVIATSVGVGTEFVLPSQSLAAGARLVLTQSELGVSDVVDGDKLYLYSSGRGALIDAVAIHDFLRGRTPEGTGEWLVPDASTFGAANAFTFRDEIVINEIMYHHRGIDATQPTTQDSTLLAIDDAWRYDDVGVDRGTAWRAAGYDDSAWPVGAGLFYNENAALPAAKNTPLAPGRNTYYFRKHFTFTGDPATAQLRIRPIVDDGAIYYLNGVEVFRQNMAVGAANYNTLANASVGDASFSGPFTIGVASLVAGDNVLAVEVHQAPRTSAYYRFEDGGASGRDVIDANTLSDHGDLVGQAGLSTDVPSPTVPQTGAANTHSFASQALGAGAGSALMNGNGAGVPFIFNNPTGDATLEWYMKVPVAQSHTSIFWTDVNDAGGIGFNIFWNASFTGAPNSDRFIAGGLEADLQIIGTYNNGNPLALNTWHHVAIVRTDLGGGSFQWRWFINGVHSPGHDRTTGGASWPNFASWTLSGRPGFTFNVLLDEVRMTNAALATSEFLNAAPTTSSGDDDVVFGAELSATTIVSPGLPYHDSPEEWIELYNRSNHSVDLTGWRLDEGIDYDFPTGTVIPADGYLVVAKDKAYLQAIHPSIAMVGDYNGSLSDGDERIVLKDDRGNPADELHYYDDKPWPSYADGGGSSLELRDPRADNSLPEAWTASDEGSKSSWQTYTYRGIAGPNHSGTTYHELVLGLLDAGEVLLDDIRVVENPSTAPKQLVQQSNFESGVFDRWRIIGNHVGAVITDPTNPANKVLRVVATGPTEDRHNHAETTLKDGATFVSIVPGREYEISFRAKWIAGSSLLNTRLYFNRVTRTTTLNVPEQNGTPGARNSRFESNIGPTYHDLTQTPVVPQVNQAVTVSVVAIDPDGIGAMTLRYAVNNGAFSNVAMTALGDGRYTGVIPGQAASALVQFYVQGQDAAATTATSFYPAAGSASRALYKVNDGQANLVTLHNFRILMTSPDATTMHTNFNVMSNGRFGATVIYDENTVYYDVGVRLKGAPSSRPSSSGGYNVRFHADQLFRGVQQTVTIDRNNVNEILALTLNRHAGGVPALYNDLTYFIGPVSGRTGIAQMRLAGFGDEYLSTQYENGDDGAAFEKELTYIPSTTTGGPEGFKIPQPYEHPVELNTDITDYGENEDTYRFHWLTENHRDADDYSRIIDLNQAFSLTGAALDAATRDVIDVDQWLRAFTVPRILGNRDFYSQPGGPPGSWNHNLIVYVRPSDNKVLALPWDLDESYQEPITGSIIGGMNWAKVAQLPGNLRKYYAHYYDLITTAFNSDYMTYWVNHYSALAPGVDFNGPKNYIVSRGNYILSQLPAAIAFEITTNGGADFNTSESSVVLQGNAWYRNYELRIAGRPEPLAVTWLDADTWQAVVPLHHGANELVVQGFGLHGEVISTDSITVTSSSGVPAQDALRVAEVMYNPPGDDATEFIEIVNIAAQPIDLTGVSFAQGIDFTFSNGNLGPGQRIVIAADLVAFAAKYPQVTNVVGPFAAGTRLANEGETITLVDAAGVQIQSFSYDDAWYADTDGGGHSLERIDPLGPLPDWNVAAGWQSSAADGGSPGEDDLTPGDVNGDHRVDLTDLILVQRTLGTESLAVRQDGDLNGDGAVNRADVAILAKNFGRTAPAQAASIVAVARASSVSVDASRNRASITAARIRAVRPNLADRAVADLTSQDDFVSLTAHRRVKPATTRTSDQQATAGRSLRR